MTDKAKLWIIELLTSQLKKRVTSACILHKITKFQVKKISIIQLPSCTDMLNHIFMQKENYDFYRKIQTDTMSNKLFQF